MKQEQKATKDVMLTPLVPTGPQASHSSHEHHHFLSFLSYSNFTFSTLLWGDGRKFYLVSYH